MEKEICAYCRKWDDGKERDEGEIWCEERHTWVMATENACKKFWQLPFFGESRKKEKAEQKIKEAERAQKEFQSAGCYITTCVVHILNMKDDCVLLHTLRSLRTDYMQKDAEYKDLLLKYDTVGPVIAAALVNDENRCQIAEDIVIYLAEAQSFINKGEFAKAISGYIELTEALIRKYGISYVIGEEVQKRYDQANGGHGSITLKPKDVKSK